jgi:hypothetical protein
VYGILTKRKRNAVLLAAAIASILVPLTGDCSARNKKQTQK